jgi:hypothetical protein
MRPTHFRFEAGVVFASPPTLLALLAFALP